MKPKISVIVPVYNVEEWIERCARSLFEQTLDDIEYIFIDDCSTDKSIQVLKSVIEQYPLLQQNIHIVINNQNIGPSATRNKGIKISNGDYIIFCDSDDYLELNAYELLYNEAVKDSFDIVACGVYVDSSSNQEIKLFKSKENLAVDSLYDIRKLEGTLYSSAWNKLVKRELFVNHAIYFHEDVKMWDDLYLMFQLRYFANKTSIVNLPLYHYVQHENSLIRSNVKDKHESQLRCAHLIEDFVEKQNECNQFKKVANFLKFRASDMLFCDEYINNWILNAQKYNIIQFLSFYGSARILLYYIVKMVGINGWNFLKVYKRLKGY